MEARDQRAFNYEVSEAIAPGWERRRAEMEEVLTPLREWMIRELRPTEGDTLVELAAGVGDTGLEAARLVGDGGRLICTDFSPAMLEGAKRRGAEIGVTNVEYRAMDAERLELDPDSVDGVLCRFGYMLMPDPSVALAETRRVLRPGGRLVLAVWGAPERNPYFSSLGMRLVELGHIPPPDPEAPGMFSMASEERTKALLSGAGFGEVLVEEVPVRFTFEDVDGYLTFMAEVAGPMALALRALSEDEWKELETRLEEAFEPFATDAGYEVPGTALAAAAS